MSWGGRKAQALLRLVLEEYGPVCHLCLVGIDLDLPPGHKRGPSSDHVVPRKFGGSDDLENLRPAHRSCNSRRGARLLTPALLSAFRARRPESGAGFFRRDPRTTRPHVQLIELEDDHSLTGSSDRVVEEIVRAFEIPASMHTGAPGEADG